MSNTRARVLIVGGDLGLDDSLRAIGPDDLEMEFRVVSDQREMMDALNNDSYDVLVVDASGSGHPVEGFLEHARNVSPQSRIILTGDVSVPRQFVKAFTMGTQDYLHKPFTAEDLLRSISRVVSAPESPTESERFSVRLDSARKQSAFEGIRALVCAVEAKDHNTRGHSEHVAHYARRLAERIGMPPDQTESVFIAALVHDVGKIGVPDSILTKPGQLTEEELEAIRYHPALGEYIIRNLSVFAAEANIVRHHHENWNGSGYPDGLSGEQIPFPSRVLRVADAMDAMLTQRSYKSPYPIEAMLVELSRCAGREFDIRIASAAVEWCRMNPRELILPEPQGKLDLVETP
jgi:HD-GYP domain-containing protein (c-di-GMP phosphodiesterase class II)